MQSLLDRFLSDFETYKNYEFLAVEVENEKAPSFEVIVNVQENFESKKEYYALAYDNNLFLKANPTIKIVDWAFVDNFEDIQYALGLN